MDEADRVLVYAIKILIREDVESFLKDGIVPQGKQASIERNEEQE